MWRKAERPAERDAMWRRSGQPCGVEIHSPSGHGRERLPTLRMHAPVPFPLHELLLDHDRRICLALILPVQIFQQLSQ